MHKLIEVKHRVMRNKIDHAVLTYIIYNGHSGKIDGREKAHQSADG